MSCSTSNLFCSYSRRAWLDLPKSSAGNHSQWGQSPQIGGLTLLSSRGARPPNGCWSCLGISVFPSAVEMQTKEQRVAPGWGRREGWIQKTWDQAAERGSEGEWRVCSQGVAARGDSPRVTEEAHNRESVRSVPLRRDCRPAKSGVWLLAEISCASRYLA